MQQVLLKCYHIMLTFVVQLVVRVQLVQCTLAYFALYRPCISCYS